MFTTKQCCAPIQNNGRCTNLTKDANKVLCEKHYPQGAKLYKRYKTFCDKADKLDVDEVKTFPTIKEKISFLNKCYCSYITAYNARMKHRNKFIVPDCRDYGHDEQFRIIKRKIDACEKELEKLYTKKDLPIKETTLFVVEVEEPIEEVSTFVEKVKSFRQQRKDDEKETNKVIAEYMKQNGAYLKSKKIIIDLCYYYLYSYLTEDKKFACYHMCCMIDSLVILLGAIIKPEQKNFSDCKSHKYFMGFIDVNSYVHLRDLFEHFDLENIGTFAQTITSCRVKVDHMFEQLKEVWKRTTFNPLISTLHFRTNGTQCVFEIVQLC